MAWLISIHHVVQYSDTSMALQPCVSKRNCCEILHFEDCQLPICRSVEGVHLLTSGVLPTDPARLVESLRFRQLLLDLQREYDVVMVDTPPALVVNDAMVISRSVDGIVLVVESGRTNRKTVVDLRHRFESSAVEPIGPDDGSVFMGNLYWAHPVDYYMTKGGGEPEMYQPQFTYHGARVTCRGGCAAAAAAAAAAPPGRRAHM